MAVYQSVTRPEIRAMSYQQTINTDLLEAVGQDRVVRDMKKASKIPSRVQPDITVLDDGTHIRFQWYEVETFR